MNTPFASNSVGLAAGIIVYLFSPCECAEDEHKNV